MDDDARLIVCKSGDWAQVFRAADRGDVSLRIISMSSPPVVIRLSPHEARRVATALARSADTIEVLPVIEPYDPVEEPLGSG